VKKDKGEKDAGHNTEPGGVRASPLGDARARRRAAPTSTRAETRRSRFETANVLVHAGTDAAQR